MTFKEGFNSNPSTHPHFQQPSARSASILLGRRGQDLEEQEVGSLAVEGSRATKGNPMGSEHCPATLSHTHNQAN